MAFAHKIHDVGDISADGNAPPCRPDVTRDVTAGAGRLLADMGCAVLCEMRLPNGRRADLVGLCAKGRLTLIEVKSCRADFEIDTKWPDYLDYAEDFYFAVPADFPVELLPDGEGLIVADRFGGEVIRPCTPRKLAAARRKSLTLHYARQAAFAAARNAAL